MRRFMWFFNLILAVIILLAIHTGRNAYILTKMYNKATENSLVDNYHLTVKSNGFDYKETIDTYAAPNKLLVVTDRVDNDNNVLTVKEYYNYDTNHYAKYENDILVSENEISENNKYSNISIVGNMHNKTTKEKIIYFLSTFVFYSKIDDKLVYKVNNILYNETNLNDSKYEYIDRDTGFVLKSSSGIKWTEIVESTYKYNFDVQDESIFLLPYSSDNNNSNSEDINIELPYDQSIYDSYTN